MRNLFDQYVQPENRLTHALVSTLEHDRKLLGPFLRWLELGDVPPVGKLSICEQQVPGVAQSELEEGESKGLPDAFIYNADGWAVLFECKVQAKIDARQVKRHRITAKRHGFESPHIVVIAVEPWKVPHAEDVTALTWKDIYGWFSSKARDSFWAGEFVRYMQVFERTMLAQNYDIRGTITVFDGLRFDNDNPYTYREGKRLIRLLADQLQGRKDLHRLGVDPTGKRRPAITGRGAEGVWDFLPLSRARSAGQFTDFPHLTIAFNRSYAVSAVTVPNGVKGGFRSKLKRAGPNGFMDLLAEVENGVRPIIKRSRKAKPMIYLTQRRFRGQRSIGEVDGRLDADLRTATAGNSGAVKYQPEWLLAIYNLLVQKKSNMQMGVEVRLSYECPLVRSPKAEDLFAESWKALAPLISFVVNDKQLPDKA